MVRPRLVEEGLPIGVANNNTYDHDRSKYPSYDQNDDDNNDTYAMEAETVASSPPQQPQPQPRLYSSSLQLAAAASASSGGNYGASSWLKKNHKISSQNHQKRSTHIVIGGDDSEISTNKPGTSCEWSRQHLLDHQHQQQHQQHHKEKAQQRDQNHSNNTVNCNNHNDNNHVDDEDFFDDDASLTMMTTDYYDNNHDYSLNNKDNLNNMDRTSTESFATNYDPEHFHHNDHYQHHPQQQPQPQVPLSSLQREVIFSSQIQCSSKPQLAYNDTDIHHTNNPNNPLQSHPVTLYEQSYRSHPRYASQQQQKWKDPNTNLDPMISAAPLPASSLSSSSGLSSKEIHINNNSSNTSEMLLTDFIFHSDESLRSLTVSAFRQNCTPRYETSSSPSHPSTAAVPLADTVTTSIGTTNRIRPTRTHIEIGAMEDVIVHDDDDEDVFDDDNSESHYIHSTVERMVGVEDHGYKAPMVVLDGANIAYAYSKTSSSYSNMSSSKSTNNHKKLEPNVHGILVACQYFERAGLRVLVVLQQSYYSRVMMQQGTSIVTDHNHKNNKEWVDVIQHYLYDRGMLVLAPTLDDDDAYCLSVANRENIRAGSRRQQQQLINHPHHQHHQYNNYDGNDGRGWAYIVSNDQFRDAQVREDNANNNRNNSQLHEYLNVDVRGRHFRRSVDQKTTAATSTTLAEATNAKSLTSSSYGPGRISYTFVDMGKLDDHGDKELDFIPNPRHPLIQWIDQQ